MLALCVNLQSENLRSKKSKVNCVKLLDCLNKKRKLHNKLLTSDSSERKSVHCSKIDCYFAKGQLISKGFLMSSFRPKRNNEIFKGFLP